MGGREKVGGGREEGGSGGKEKRDTVTENVRWKHIRCDRQRRGMTRRR